MKETKYFLGKDDEDVFAVYKANFEGSQITEQFQFLIPKGTSWEPTQRVSDWYFAGWEKAYPCSKAQAESYLPESALKQ